MRTSTRSETSWRSDGERGGGEFDLTHDAAAQHGGRLITIPNSQVTVVENLTRSWSRVDITVEIAYESDVDRALEAVRGVTDELYHDPQWNPLITEQREVLGVETLSHAGVAIRVWVVTAPLQQFAVRREFNRRILIALRRHGIAIGTQQQIVRSRSRSSRTREHESEPRKQGG